MREADAGGTRGYARSILVLAARFVMFAFVLPLVAFVAVGSFAPGFHLDRYGYEAGTGYVPRASSRGEVSPPTVSALGSFYVRFAAGAAVGRSGRSREAADRPVSQLLLERARPSLVIVAVALALTAGLTALAVPLGLRASRAGGSVARWRRRLTRPLTAVLDGIPLPVAGMLAFVLVVRLAPRDSWLESPAAMVVWAGLALALGDAVAFGAARAARDEARRTALRPFLLAARLRGDTPLAAAWPVLLPLLGARLRGATLLFLGGLLVVEPALGINGLGETFRDIAVDRAGTDALLLAGVLQLFALPVALIDGISVLVGGGRRGGGQ